MHEWKDMLEKSIGKNIKVEVYAQNKEGWISFVPFYMTVAEDPIDQYISYRVIQPSYVAYELSKKTIKNIKLSLFWAFFYNVICIPIACGILYPFFGIKFNPMLASIAMSCSSVCVVLNALRLFRFKIKK
jgi:Cu+-exporting ATPase